MANEYLSYTSKDYKSIFPDLISAIPSLTDLWTNTEDGDPGIVLVKLMSILGDMLSYNLDKQALEYYTSTVTQRKNAARIYNLVGYKMHWYVSALNRITINNIMVVPSNIEVVQTYIDYLNAPNGSDEKRNLWMKFQEQLNVEQFKQTYPYDTYPQYYVDEYTINFEYVLHTVNSDFSYYSDYLIWIEQNTINIYTYITSTSATLNVYNSGNLNIPYTIKPTTASNVTSNNNYLMAVANIKPGESQDFDVIQGTLNSVQFNSSQLRNNRYYFPESTVDETNIWLSYESTIPNTNSSATVFIDKVDNLLLVTNDDIYFEFNIDEYDNPYIEISSYWSNKLGDSVDFTLYYVRTDGVYGNITKNFLDTIENIPSNMYTITHPANSTVYINEFGDLIASPGTHPQTTKQAFKDSLNYITTFNSLVTIYDFERFCKRQQGITNTFAVDGQRANDINNELNTTCASLTLAQLQAYYDSSTHMDGISRNDASNIKKLYAGRKKVMYNENDAAENYKNYGLNLHVVFENFALTMPANDDSSIYTVATIRNHIVTDSYSGVEYNAFWLYKLIDSYNPEPDTDEYRDGWVAYYLDKKMRETKVINVNPEYASIRIFPWRCCGTIHLTNTVTQQMADNILETVMEYLRDRFSPANTEFGKPLNYMDIINTVIDSHEMIKYFDAGLGSRKLIDVDESVDISYFNNTSLMYYVQTADGMTNGPMQMYGNNEEYTDVNNTIPNPYYKILSIAPEYIIQN